MNPFEELNPPPNGKMLLDKAFKKALKASYRTSRRLDKLEIIRRDTGIKIKVFGKVITDSLNSIVSNFPSLDRIDPFYQELINVLFSVDKIKLALSSVNGAVPVIREVIDEEARKLRYGSTRMNISRVRKSVYGRVSSIIRRVSDNLQFLRDLVFEAKKFPSIDKSNFTVVVAGQPNVGKSTFVKEVSTARPEIAEYPFTTKKILVGHLDYKGGRVQVIDTPGLLDREFNLRNKIELQSLIALKHLADVIIYLFDATETCGYTVSSQLKLFKHIKGLFQQTAIYPFINKSDVADELCVKAILNELGPIPRVSSIDRNMALEALNSILDEFSQQLKFQWRGTPSTSM